MFSALKKLWAAFNLDLSDLDLDLELDDDEDARKHLVFDSNKHPLFLDPEDIQRAIEAELINAAAAQDDRLVYESNWQWPIDIWGLRNLIAIAHSEPDPDMALMSIIFHHGFQEMRPDDEK